MHIEQYKRVAFFLRCQVLRAVKELNGRKKEKRKKKEKKKEEEGEREKKKKKKKKRWYQHTNRTNKSKTKKPLHPARHGQQFQIV